MTATKPRIWAVFPAAGVGKRMAAKRPKQYLDLLGQPIIVWSMKPLLEHPAIHGGVVALSEHDFAWETIQHDCVKPLQRVNGGAERGDSVLAALQFLVDRGATDDWVMVHDAVRPCLSPGDIDRLLEAGVNGPDGALLAVPVRDTLKRQEGSGRVRDTTSRDGLWHALTPQLFPLLPLFEALSAALEQGAPITDESQAMERAGYRPLLVEGKPTNIKITRQHDLALAKAVLGGVISG